MDTSNEQMLEKRWTVRIPSLTVWRRFYMLSFEGPFCYLINAGAEPSPRSWLILLIQSAADPITT